MKIHRKKNNSRTTKILFGSMNVVELNSLLLPTIILFVIIIAAIAANHLADEVLLFFLEHDVVV